MSLNKYVCQITTDRFHCTSAVVYIQPPITLYITKKKQKYNFYCRATAIYVPATNMPLKGHIHDTCPNYSVCTDWGSMPIDRPYMNLLSLMMWPEMLYTGDNGQINQKVCIGMLPSPRQSYFTTLPYHLS